MNVKELIEILKRADPERHVSIQIESDEHGKIEKLFLTIEPKPEDVPVKDHEGVGSVRDFTGLVTFIELYKNGTLGA